MSHSCTKEPTASKDLLVADRDFCHVMHWTVLRSPLADFCFRRLRRREGRVVLPNSVNPFSDASSVATSRDRAAVLYWKCTSMKYETAL